MAEEISLVEQGEGCNSGKKDDRERIRGEFVQYASNGDGWQIVAVSSIDQIHKIR
jgi:hypothetical protein